MKTPKKGRYHRTGGPHGRRDAEVFLVEGWSAVREYVENRPSSVQTIHYRENLKPQVERCLAVSNADIPLKTIENENESSSPVWAKVKIRLHDFSKLQENLKRREKDLVIALDHITDPRNLGAIVRSAAFFGVKEILVPLRRQVLLTDAAVATAQGGFSLTDLVAVPNLQRTLKAMKNEGYWVLGASMDGEPGASLVGFYDKVVLVLGAEDKGLSHGVEALCDRKVAIVSQSKTKSLDSLNVSVAAGILINLYHIS